MHLRRSWSHLFVPGAVPDFFVPDFAVVSDTFCFARKAAIRANISRLSSSLSSLSLVPNASLNMFDLFSSIISGCVGSVATGWGAISATGAGADTATVDAALARAAFFAAVGLPRDTTAASARSVNMMTQMLIRHLINN